METARTAIPIADSELDALKGVAEKHITRINGNTDLEQLLRSLTPEEPYRTVPIELDLLYTIRHAVCLYFWMSKYLFTHTGQAEEAKASDLPTPSILNKQRFSTSYCLFVMASAIVKDCDALLKGKDADKLATVKANYKYEPGRTFSIDLQVILSYYAQTIAADNGNGISLARNANDVVALTRDFWKSVAERALDDAQKADADIQAVVAKTTFKNEEFIITGFSLEHEVTTQAISFVPVQPEEIVGNTEAVVMLLRLCDRLALYNLTAKKNPLCEIGGLYESNLLDGPPGTGKTTLQRMAMTRLAMRADQVGLPYTFKSLEAKDIKSEWYGKTGKMLSETLTAILDPNSLALLMIDDIDLLLANRDDPGSGGADKDLLKGLMDFFSGIGTNYRGNYSSIAATNKPTGVDDALRQRFVYRVMVTGAESWEDYADLVALQLKRPAKQGLVSINLKGYEPLKRARAAHLMAHESATASGPGSWADIGHYIAELHSKNPAFTARTVKNAMDVVISKAGDFEIPTEFFTKPEVFRLKTWDEQVKIIKDLFGTISANAVMASLTEQFDSETRYATKRYVNQ